MTDRGEPVARLVPIAAGGVALTRLVAEGRAVAPTVLGPIPLPPVLGGPEVDVAAELAASREEDRGGCPGAG